MNRKQHSALLAFQRNEAAMTVLYRELAKVVKSPHNRQVLNDLSEKEWIHYDTARSYTGVDIHPRRWRIRFFFLLSRIFGLTFGIKMIEYNEKQMKKLFPLLSTLPDYKQKIEEQEDQEKIMIDKIDEERLQYMSSIVLGMNDAIIEFTGALAGFALAFQNHLYVAMAGAIAGIAAAMSMGASEYMSTKTESRTNQGTRNAFVAAVYTFITYLITVSLLLAPFVFLDNIYWALGICLLAGSIIVGIFNFYYAIVRSQPFWTRFLEMIAISFGVAGVSFGIGWLLKHFTGINI